MNDSAGDRPSGIKSKEIRACFLFLLSALIRLVGVGIFNTFFNIYLIDRGFSETFLGIFLGVGNAAMTLASFPIGALIDRAPKKKLLILFTLVNLACYGLQIIINDRTLLLIVSAVFGISFIGLTNLAGPFLYGFPEIGGKTNLFAVYRIVNIVSVTVGALLAGYLRSVEYPVRQILIAAVILCAVSILPLITANDPAPPPNRLPSERRQTSAAGGRSEIPPFQALGLAALFGAVGFSPMITNYINVYLQKRIGAGPDTLAYGYAGIYFFSGIIMIGCARYKIRREQFPVHVIGIGLFILSIFAALYAAPVFLVQIIGITLLIGVFELFASVLNDYVFTFTENSAHGKYAGMINLVSNLTETIGIVLCGRLIGNGQYRWIFRAGAGPILIVVLGAAFLYARELRNTRKDGTISRN